MVWAPLIAKQNTKTWVEPISSHVGDDLLYRTKQTFQGYISLRVVCLSSVTLPDSRALAKSVCDCVTTTRAAKCERRSHNESGCGCRHARAPARARPTPIHHVQSQKICVPGAGRPAARPGPCTHNLYIQLAFS